MWRGSCHSKNKVILRARCCSWGERSSCLTGLMVWSLSKVQVATNIYQKVTVKCFLLSFPRWTRDMDDFPWQYFTNRHCHWGRSGQETRNSNNLSWHPRAGENISRGKPNDTRVGETRVTISIYGNMHIEKKYTHISGVKIANKLYWNVNGNTIRILNQKND